MGLKPVERAADPRYPSRHKVFAAIGSWARRAAGVAVAAGALAFGGCYGATPFADRDLDDPPGDDPTVPRYLVDDMPGPYDEVMVMEGGVMASPSFECRAEQPEPPAYIDSWGFWEGGLCDDQTGWAFHEVYEEGLFELTITWGAEFVSLALLDPDGNEVALVDGDAPTVEVRLGAGLHVLAATTIDPEAYPHEWFGVSLNRISD